MSSTATDLRYLNSRETFLKYAHLALENHFSSYDDFLTYFNTIATDERKNSFLKTASLYLFLVKRGDWVVDVPGSQPVIDYLTNTYKYVAIFSLIESLSGDGFIDFYAFLTRHEPGIDFPITDRKQLKEHYKRYKGEFGSVRRCISFFRSLSPERQQALIARLEVEGTQASIESLAGYLYELRSKFVHEGKLVLHMSEGISVGQKGTKVVVCNLSIQDVMMFFEEGLLAYFREAET
jgi:hypothetical protein